MQVQKKIRDDCVLLSKGTNWRRSPRWMAVKAVLHNSLVNELGEVQGTVAYKTLMIVCLFSLCPDLSYTLKEGLHLVHFTIVKVARRLLKLQKIIQSNNDLILPPIIAQMLSHIDSKATLRHEKLVTRVHHEADIESRHSLLKPTNSETIIAIQELDHISVQGNILAHSSSGNTSRWNPFRAHERGKAILTSVDMFTTICATNRGSSSSLQAYAILSSFEYTLLSIAAEDVSAILAHKWNTMEHLQTLRSYSEKSLAFYNRTKDVFALSRRLLCMYAWFYISDIHICQSINIASEYEVPLNLECISKLLCCSDLDCRVLKAINTHFTGRKQAAKYHDLGCLASGNLSLQSLSIRLAKESVDVQLRREQILEESERQEQEKRSELDKVFALYHAKKLQYEQLNCEFGDKWVHRSQSVKNVHLPSCKRCKQKKAIESLAVSKFEKLLPQSEVNQLLVAFEIELPKSLPHYGVWRDSLAALLQACKVEMSCNTVSLTWKNLLHVDRNWLHHAPMIDFAVSLASHRTRTNEALKVSHAYSKEEYIQENRHDTLLSFGTTTWLSEGLAASLKKTEIPNLKSCLSTDDYKPLHRFITSSTHQQNDVIASQMECSHSMSSNEFVTFGSLRAGERLQWFNLERALEQDALNLHKESVIFLLLNMLHEAGEEESDTSVRCAHVALFNPELTLSLCRQLNRVLDSSPHGWNNHRVLFSVSFIANRICEVLSTQVPLSDDVDDALQQAELVRKLCRSIGKQWILDIKLKIRQDISSQCRQQYGDLLCDIAMACLISFDSESSSVLCFQDNQSIEDFLFFRTTLWEFSVLAGTVFDGFRRSMFNLVQHIVVKVCPTKSFTHPDVDLRACLVTFLEAYYKLSGSLQSSNVKPLSGDASRPGCEVEFAWKCSLNESATDVSIPVNESATDASIVVNSWFGTLLGVFYKFFVGVESSNVSPLSGVVSGPVNESTAAAIIVINFWSGHCLFNGIPSGKLPDCFTQKTLFKTSFSGIHFDAFCTSDGTHHTLNKFMNVGSDRISHFEFNLNCKGHLVVTECSSSESGGDARYLQLVPPDLFQPILPMYFVERFSHWLDRSQKCVYFRPVHISSPEFFNEAAIMYELRRQATGWVLYRKHDDAALLRMRSDSFAILRSLLHPIEDEQFIHAWFLDKKQNEGYSKMLHVDVHRYHLEFDYDAISSTLRCRDHHGWSWDSFRPETLLGLQSCIVLKKDLQIGEHCDYMFIIPYNLKALEVGQLNSLRNNHHCVSISRDASLNDIPYFVYTLDNSMRVLRSQSSQTALLYLALLHGLTSSMLEDKFTGVTGMEAAFDILRSAQSFSCSPYDQDDEDILKAISARLVVKRDPILVYDQIIAQRITWPTQAAATLCLCDQYKLLVDEMIFESKKVSFLFERKLQTAKPEDMSSKESERLHRSAATRDSALLPSLCQESFAVDVSGLTQVLFDSWEPNECIGDVVRSVLLHVRPDVESQDIEAVFQRIAETIDRFPDLDQPKLSSLKLSSGRPLIDYFIALQQVLQEETTSHFQRVLLLSGVKTILQNPHLSWNSYYTVKLFDLLVDIAIQSDLGANAVVAPHPDVTRLVTKEPLCASAENYIQAFRPNILNMAAEFERYNREVSDIISQCNAHRMECIEEQNEMSLVEDECEYSTGRPYSIQSIAIPLSALLSPLYGQTLQSSIAERNQYLMYKRYCEYLEEVIEYAPTSPCPSECVSHEVSVTPISLRWCEVVAQPLERFTLPPSSSESPCNIATLCLEAIHQIVAEAEFAIHLADGVMDQFANRLRRLFHSSDATVDEADAIIDKFVEDLTVPIQSASPVMAFLEAMKDSEKRGLISQELQKFFKGTNVSQSQLAKNTLRRIQRAFADQFALSSFTCGLLFRATPSGYVQLLASRNYCNAYLSDDPIEQLKPVARQMCQGVFWTQKAKRLLKFLKTENLDWLCRELESMSMDKTAVDRPLIDPDIMLTFELDNDLSVRPIQLKVAECMYAPTRQSSTSLQLNMGEGKTSVILPLVASALADEDQLMRVIVLPSQLRTNSQDLVWRVGGLLDRRVYRLPFSREIELNKERVASMLDVLQECRERRGILIVAPEQIQSMKLRYVELMECESSLASHFHAVIDFLQQHSRDIIDETDAVLHHNTELVYAIGADSNPDGGEDRWKCMQYLMHAVGRAAPRLKEQFGPSSVEYHGYFQEASKFFALRILTADPDTTAKVYHALCQYLSEDKELYQDLHLHKLARKSHEHEILWRCILSSTLSDSDREWILQKKDLHATIVNTVLVLRGLLLYEVLLMLLTMRYMVDYGIDEEQELRRKKTKLAVPFRAKNCPADRAEFAHADVAIGVTVLSYYQRGLSEKEMDEVLNFLQRNEAKERIFDIWVQSVGSNNPTLSYSGINREDQSFMTNILYPFMRYHMLVIDYYLCDVVFPSYSKQFPGKISASAWDLCPLGNAHIVTGFSGTNDSRDLLPTSMHVDDEKLTELRATSAMVCKTILRPENNNYLPLSNEFTGRDILCMISSGDAHALRRNVLIDAGALMIDMDNHQVAKEWLSLRSTDATINACIFFDKNLLCVIRKSSPEDIIPLSLTPFMENLEGVLLYIDDLHCRGTDLRVPPDTQAAVTLGRGLCKDKLVQACMRMRRLTTTHSLCFVAPQEVHLNVERLVSRSDQDAAPLGHNFKILLWCLWNSVQFVRDGFLTWASHGLSHARLQAVLKGELSTCIVRDKDTLENDYLPDRVQHPVPELVNTWADLLPRPIFSLEPEQKVINEIISRCERLTPTRLRYASLLDEQQEREVEVQQQSEVEYERVPAAKPATEVYSANLTDFIGQQRSWSCDTIWSSLCSSRLGNTYRHIAQHQAWTRRNLCSSSFASTIAAFNYHTYDTDKFLRPLWWIVVSRKESGIDLMAVSPFEAEILIVAHRKGAISDTISLMSYAPIMRLNRSHLLRVVFGEEFDEDELKCKCLRMSLAELFLFSGSLFFPSSCDDPEHSRRVCDDICSRLQLQLGVTDEDEGVDENGFRSQRARGKFETNPLSLVMGLYSLRCPIAKVVELSHAGKVLWDHSDPFISLVATSTA